MQESIFYNKEQIKIIRYYGFIHKTLFKYGVALAAGILSLIASFYMITSGYFSSIYLLEKKDDVNASQAMTTYNNKQQQVASIPGLKGILLNGRLNITNGNIISEDVLLEKDGLTLPRKTSISTTDLDNYIKWLDKENLTANFMQSFFQTVLINPTLTNNSPTTNPILLSLGGSSLKNLFGLECTTTKSSSSFVCKSYVRNFLDHFYLYDLSQSTNEITFYFNALSSNSHYKKNMCDGILMYGNFVTEIDGNLSDLFRNCGSDKYNKFVLLREFLNLNKQFGVGYVDTTAYNDRNLNEYKLYSLQQVIYRGITSSADVKAIIQSYIGFLREVLIKEDGRQDELLSTFSKSFAYWFNMNVLSPYFKNEKSKMSKEDRTSINADMLTINHGDTVAGFKGLQGQSRYVYETPTTTKTTTTTTTKEKQSLKDIFIQSYLPADFNLYTIETGDNEDILYINGEDLRTNYMIDATLKYENLQLYVVSVYVYTEKNIINETLSSFINSTLSSSKTKNSLNQTLTLINDNKDFASKASDKIEFCDQIKQQFKAQLVSCNEDIVELSSKNIGVAVEEPVIYTFTLTKGVLTDVQISHELLASQLLSALDLSNVDKTSTLNMIQRIMAYQLQDTDTGFGLKEYRGITETIERYLGKAAKIDVDNGVITVSFSAGGVNFSANYDSVNKELNPISILISGRRPIIVQGLKLSLNENNVKGIKDFLDDPISKLNEINPALVEKYFNTENKK